MKKTLFLALFITTLFANEVLLQIETSIKSAEKEFEIQKKDNNISKLLEISKTLYENNKKLKKLKEKYSPKLFLKLISQKPLNNLQVGDVLEAEAKTLHSNSEDYQDSVLNFFIYKEDTLLATKHIDIYEKGGIHKEHIKFKIIKPSKDYKICATFKENRKKYDTCKTFNASQPIITKPIIASVSLDATSSDEVLIPNQKFYLFMPFKNNTDTTLKGKITITDAKSQEVIFDKKFKKKPSKEFKKAGVLVPAKLALENRLLHVNISLGADGINPIKKEKNLKISSYKWEVNFPQKLETKQTKNFYITPPKIFQKPFEISIEPNGGVLIGYKKNRLSGTIEAITDKKKSAYVDISIEDSNKKRVKKRIYITLNQDYITPKENQHSAKIKKIDNVPIGQTKTQSCPTHRISSGSYGKCLYRFDGRHWRLADGKIKLYYSSTHENFFTNTYAIKDRLAFVGYLKNGKLDSKAVFYHGNGQIKRICYYQNGKKIPYNEVEYFEDGRIRHRYEIIDGHKISANFSKDYENNYYLYKYYEKIGTYTFKYKGSYISVSDNNGYKICDLRFENKKANEVRCYFPSTKKQLAGQIELSSFHIEFYSKNKKFCTNRVDSKGKLIKCKKGEDNYFIKRLSLFNKILAQTKEGNRYLKELDFSDFGLFYGVSNYYLVYSDILYNKTLLYIYGSNKKCKANNFNYLNKKLSKNDKKYLFKKAGNMNYTQIKKMIMTLFAKTYYKKERKRDFCYTQLRNFYKRLGYLNGY